MASPASRASLAMASSATRKRWKTKGRWPDRGSLLLPARGARSRRSHRGRLVVVAQEDHAPVKGFLQDRPFHAFVDVPHVQDSTLRAASRPKLFCSRSLTASLCSRCSSPSSNWRNYKSASGLATTMAERPLPNMSFHCCEVVGKNPKLLAPRLWLRRR